MCVLFKAVLNNALKLSSYITDCSLPVRCFLAGAQEVVGGLPLPLAPELIEAGAPVRCLLALLTAVPRLQQL